MISFNTINYIWILVAVSTFIILISFNIKAPYGRHSSNSWGRMIANKWGWFFMELPAFLLMPIVSITGPSEKKLFINTSNIFMASSLRKQNSYFPFQTKNKQKENATCYSLKCSVF